MTTFASSACLLRHVHAPAIFWSLVAFITRALWILADGSRDWPDTQTYLAAGRQLLEHGVIRFDNVMPLYPLVLYLAGYEGVLWLQAALSAATVGLMYLLAREIFAGRLVAHIAALIGALHPLLIFYSAMRLTETVFIFFFILASLLFMKRYFLIGAVAFVLSILVRPTFDLVGPLLIILFSFLDTEADWREHIKRTAIYIGVYLALMGPWWIHNYLKYHEFVRLNLGSGVFMLYENNNSYLESGLNYDVLNKHIGEYNRQYSAAGDRYDAVGRNAAMQASALQWIQLHPFEWLTNVIDRLKRFWSPISGSDSPLITVVEFASTFPIMLAAFVQLARLDRRQWRLFLPFVTAGLYLTVVHAAFHGLPRYRLPLEPVLIILAAGLISHLISTVFLHVKVRHAFAVNNRNA